MQYCAIWGEVKCAAMQGGGCSCCKRGAAGCGASTTVCASQQRYQVHALLHLLSMQPLNIVAPLEQRYSMVRSRFCALAFTLGPAHSVPVKHYIIHAIYLTSLTKFYMHRFMSTDTLLMFNVVLLYYTNSSRPNHETPLLCVVTLLQPSCKLKSCWCAANLQWPTRGRF